MALEQNTKESGEFSLTLENKEEAIKYDIRLDGCIHIKRFWNGNLIDSSKNADMDYLHICELDKFIEELQAVKLCAVAYFNNKWPE